MELNNNHHSNEMTCQTGIRADTQLLDFFEQCKQCKYRFGKIVINKERLCINHHLQPSKDWRKDWRRCLPECVDSYEPCFLLFRFDSSHDWLLISFADDKASVRDKMLLAATKATFKSEFGQSFIRNEYQIANRNDLHLDSFEKRYLSPQNGESGIENFDESKPLSFVERELSTVAKERATIPFSMHASQTLRGVQFPIDQDAQEQLRAFGQGTMDFVQLSVDCLNEAIKLEVHKTMLDDLHELTQLIPKQKPRYSLYRFRNEKLQQNDHQAVFFIYSVPPSQSCTIKELMLYSSCKAPLLSELQGTLGVKLDKKIEMDSRDKLDESTLLGYVTLEPQQAGGTPSAVTQFERPQRPGNGPRRITKVIE